MTDPRRVTAHFGAGDGQNMPARLAALEGGGGYMRVLLDGPGAAALATGQEGELEMHDGARFTVVVTEVLPPEGEAAAYRMKLLSKVSQR